MERPSPNSDRVRWLDSSGLIHLFRIPRLALRIDALLLGLAGVVLTLMYGTVLDKAWAIRGGVAQDAVARFLHARETEQDYTEPQGDFGVFQVWREFECQGLMGLLASMVPFKSVAGGTSLGQYLDSHSRHTPMANAVNMGYGTLWLVRQHPVYSAFLIAGLVLIWSWAGGGMCRIAAVQFAKDEVLTLQRAERYARERCLGGFVLAPVIPLGMAAFTAFLMVVGGMFLWIPLIGDLAGGGVFFLALFGGSVIAALGIGLATAGHLFWPAVAADGADGFDAFSRAFSYVLTKPWRSFFYALVSLVYIALYGIAAHLFVFLSLRITRAVVSFGTAPFGWGERVIDGRSYSKLELLWPLPGPDALYAVPVWGQLRALEHVSAFLIWIWVLLVVAALWSYMASLYYSACTVSYFLLRRDVDGTDLEDMFDEESEDAPAAGGESAATPAAPGPASQNVQSSD